MALGRTFVCTGCAHAIEAWDEGNPYYVDERGERRYVYHPSPERARATGIEWPALCLGCGAEITQDSAARVARCPGCASPDVVDAWELEGRTCPYCRAGVYVEDERALKIS
jgi:DNA-directed RNA polymerase subunit RPC12/RpoP